MRIRAAWDRLVDELDLDSEHTGVGQPHALFLGPKAENQDVLARLIAEAIEWHCGYRREFHPEDPEIITPDVKRGHDYKDGVARLEQEARKLFKLLRKSAPVFSLRHQGHMLWDQAMPAQIGYFAAMLYNQNNVAAESSPITTALEIKLCRELCQMLGFPVTSRQDNPAADLPWGHITCGGSVANIEALWALRNAKFFALALRKAIVRDPLLAPAKTIAVSLPDGSRAPLVDLDPWALLNLKIDDVLKLPDRITREFGIGASLIQRTLRRYSIQHIGLSEFYRSNVPSDIGEPCVIVPSTRHYSWDKATTLLGLGDGNLLKVSVDPEARMDAASLEAALEYCKDRNRPVIAVVAVIGSTEESAVDPLRQIIDLRKYFREGGLDFAVHCDAAWGGYFNTMYRDDHGGEDYDPAPAFPMSDYVRMQYAALGEADSITVDPHKAGYVPYPAGALCYRNSRLRDMISLKAPVVFHGESEESVGVYGIEGSKPGAAAAAVYLAHKVIRPTRSGYGKILGQCVWASKRLYCRLLTMADRDPLKRLSITLLQRLPAERASKGHEAERRERDLIASFVPLTNGALEQELSEPEAWALFRNLGSDQVILSYSFNFFDARLNAWNKSAEKHNALNEKIFEICSITNPDIDPGTLNLILTASKFNADDYGRAFIGNYCNRAGIEYPTDRDMTISFLISTTMNPWPTETPGVDFLETIEVALRKAAYEALGALDF